MTAQQKTVKLRSNQGWQSLPETWPDCARKVFAARGIETESELTYPLNELPKPDQLSGMEQATDILKQAIKQDWAVMIVADFDADGATSCALAIRGLKAMGAKHINYTVPSRFTHGYGLSAGLVAEMVKIHHIDLIITVDNGISSIEGVARAQEQGIKVIITDHHLPGAELPKADAIVNPNLQQDQFPSKNMAGVGVCFYLLLGLRQVLRADGWFEQQNLSEPQLLQLADLLAVGTVADVVKLDRLNRTFVAQGLARIRAGKTCPGISALLNITGKSREALVSSDLGFALGPRLNAAGRLEDMSLGIELLLTDDQQTAMEIAQQLNSLNLQRRELEQDMQSQAAEMLESLPLQQQQSLAYCLYDPSWHQGVVGLLAARVKERHYRPTVIFARGEDGELKGSARSIAGVHIRDVLAQIDSETTGLIEKFGGHAMAAGLTIKENQLATFEQALQATLAQVVDPDVLKAEFVSDGQLADEEINLDMAEYLLNVAPWGQGFSEPQFHGEFYVENMRLVGQQQNHLRLNLASSDGRSHLAMAFGQHKPDWLQVGDQVIACYKLAVNEFRAQKQLQLIIDELIPV